MSFVHDIIKIKLSREGYLPNYPPHLISDEEMVDAFLVYSDWDTFSEDSTPYYFRDRYPIIDQSLQDEYKALLESIAYYLNRFKESLDHDRKLPDWIYSYMLDAVVTVDSDIRDIHDLLVPLGIDNLYDEFRPEACEKCYEVSSKWLSRLPKYELGKRVPTIFGEPHVIKYLRLTTSSVTVV